MRPSTNILMIAAVGAVAGVCGFFVGERLLGGGRAPSAESVAPVMEETPLPEIARMREVSEMSPELADLIAAGLKKIGEGEVNAALAELLHIEDPGLRREAFFELLGYLDGDQLRGLALGMLTAEDDSPESELINELFDDMIDAMAVFDRWAELDEEGVAAFLVSPRLTDPGGWFDTEGIFRAIALALIAQRSPEKAISLSTTGPESLSSMLGDGSLAEVLFWGLSMNDPALGLRSLREHWVGEGDAYTDVDELFRQLGSRVGLALPEALLFPPGSRRDEVVAELFKAWGKSDPGAALAAARGLSPSDGSESLVGVVFAQFAEVDPHGAVAAVEAMPLDEQEALVNGVAGVWMESDPGGALAWAHSKLDGKAFAQLFNEGANAVSEEVGMAVVAEMLSEEARQQFLESAKLGDDEHFLRRMIDGDALGAVAWLREIDGLHSMGSGSELGKAAMRQDPEAAMQIAADLERGELRDSYLASAARELARHDPLLALEWAADLGGDDGGAVYEKSLDVWVGRDAGAAYAWLVESESGDPLALGRRLDDHSLLEEWVEQEPASAADAMALFPEDLAPGRVADVVGLWAQAEPAGVSSYINERFEPGSLRDAAVSALVEQIKADDPAGALEWAGTITDPEQRQAVLRSAVVESLNSGE